MELPIRFGRLSPRLQTFQPSMFLLPLGTLDQRLEAAAAAEEDSQQDSALIVSLWSKLPEDILERVLAYLPPFIFLKFRCVCRRWSLLAATSRSFLSLRTQICPPFLCLINVVRGKVAGAPLNVVETNQAWKTLSFLPNPYTFFSCRASDGGLLLCEWDRLSSRKFLVCNPITKRWRDLPPLPQQEQNRSFLLPYIVSLVVDRPANRYRVVVVGECRPLSSRNDWNRHLMATVYDSLKRSWKVTSSLLHGCAAPYFSTRATVWNGAVVWIEERNCTGRLLMFHMDEEVWDRVQTYSWPQAVLYPQLLEHKGSLLMVGGLEASCSMMLWSLDSTLMKWVEVEKMSDEIGQDVFQYYPNNANPLRYRCFISQDWIFYCSSSRTCGVYNLAQRRWKSLPVSPSINCIRNFLFEPRLEAIP